MKEISSKTKPISNEELKKEFVKYFGIEKWNHEEALGKLWPTMYALCEFLNVEPIPVIVDDIDEDSRYYPNDDYIVISSKLICDEVEALKCLIHEIKHYQQYMCVIHNITDNPFYNEWKEDYLVNYKNITSYEEMLALSIEIDAFAFTKYIMKEWFNMEIIYPEETYDNILNLYIRKYF